MKKTLVSALLLLFIATPLAAMDLNAGGCTEALIAVQNALAVPGDRIVITGNCTWTTSVPIKAGVSFASLTGSTITDGTPTTGSALVMTVQAGVPSLYPSDLTGITFDGNQQEKGGTDGVIEIINQSDADAVNAFRIHGNSCVNVSRRCILVKSTQYSPGYLLTGVIDDNDFEGVIRTTGTWNYQHVTCIAAPTYPSTGNNRPWQRSAVLDFGSINSVYVENNRMVADEFGDGVLEGYGGCSYVLRMNDIQNSTQGHHGTDSGAYRGTKQYEIYGNEFTTTGGLANQRMFNFRSGNGFAWANTADTGYSATRLFYDIYRSTAHGGTIPAPWFKADGTRAWDQNGSPTGYALIDQIGWLFTDDALNPGAAVLTPNYAFLNTRNTVQVNFTTHVAGEASWITENREHYNQNNTTCVSGAGCTAGVGTGTSLPTTCTTNTGFWKTNEGTWNDGSNPNYTGQGVFYKCTSTDVWTLYYTPLAYPHPLVSGLLLTSISPDFGVQGTTESVTLTGAGFNGTDSGASTAVNISGTLITQQNLVTSDTSITVDFVIDAGAATGVRTVTVTSDEGESGPVNFTVITGSPGPSLSSISPSAVRRATTMPLTFTGTDFDGGNATITESCDGVSFSNIVAVNATTVTALMVITYDASLNPCAAAVTTDEGTSNTQNVTLSVSGFGSGRVFQ